MPVTDGTDGAMYVARKQTYKKKSVSYGATRLKYPEEEESGTGKLQLCCKRDRILYHIQYDISPSKKTSDVCISCRMITYDIVGYIRSSSQ